MHFAEAQVRLYKGSKSIIHSNARAFDTATVIIYSSVINSH